MVGLINGGSFVREYFFIGLGCPFVTWSYYLNSWGEG